MAERVLEKNAIAINGFQYRLVQPAQFFLASRQPGKVAIGDYNDETNPRASSISYSDLTRGIGVEEDDPTNSDHRNRAWYGTVNLSHSGQIVLPRRTTTVTQATAADIGILADFKNQVFASFGTTIYSYNNSNNTWTSQRASIAGNATDWAVGLLYPSGTATETFVVANGTDVDYATDATTWAENTTQAIEFLTFWKDLLWGINNAGQLFYTDDISTAWTSDAQLPLSAGACLSLLVARGPDNQYHLYASTSVGLWVHDDVNSRFVETEFSDLPFHPDGGKGTIRWRGRIRYPAGNGMYTVIPGANETIVMAMGPDRDHGLPSSRRGRIVALAGSHNELLAALDSSTGAGISNVGTRGSGGAGSSRWNAFGSQTGYSLILGWDEKGWQVKWQSGASSRAINDILVSNVYSEYRLWWAANQNVYYQTLPVDVINPLQVSTTTYADEATLETPWFTAGVRNQDKLALSTFVETTNPSSSETVKIEYATNYTESYTTLGTITSSGEQAYYFGSSREGIVFRSIKFRITLVNGSTNTNTPVLRSLVLNYRKRIKVLYGIEAVLDITESMHDASPQLQLSRLRSAANNGTLVEITTVNDTGDAQNYYMDIEDIRSVEESGNYQRGRVLLRAAEPGQSTTR